MKKIVISVLLAVLFITIAREGVSASEVTHGRHYADTNQDGICDYCGEKDGCNLDICNVKGKYFVDKDGDGLCDNCTEGSVKCRNQRNKKNYANCGKNRNSRHHSSHYKNR